MENLRGLELTNAMKRCYEYPKYSVGVIFDNESRMHDFIEAMKEEMETSELWSVAPRKKMISCKNGSYITAIYYPGATKTGMKGYRFNEILFDGEIFTDGIIKTVFYPLLQTYKIDESLERNGKTTLDNFLDEFKIN